MQIQDKRSLKDIQEKASEKMEELTVDKLWIEMLTYKDIIKHLRIMETKVENVLVPMFVKNNHHLLLKE